MKGKRNWKRSTQGSTGSSGVGKGLSRCAQTDALKRQEAQRPYDGDDFGFDDGGEVYLLAADDGTSMEIEVFRDRPSFRISSLSFGDIAVLQLQFGEDVVTFGLNSLFLFTYDAEVTNIEVQAGFLLALQRKDEIRITTPDGNARAFRCVRTPFRGLSGIRA